MHRMRKFFGERARRDWRLAHTTRKLKRRQYRPLVVVAFLLSLCHTGQAQQAPGASPSTPSGGEVTLFQNVRVFDGKSTALSGQRNVLVRGNKIERISTSPIPTDRSATTTLIDGGGRTLMPGLIDNHWHTMMVRPTPVQLLMGDVGHLYLVAGAEATATLMRGFTTVRDVGGPAFGLKRAIDEGTVAGPRIYPSGAIITITSGHGDFRQPFEVPRILGSPQSRGEQTGAAMIADSPDEVRVRVREQLMLGASQTAENWGTYVTVHAYHARLDPARDRRRREVHRTRPPDGRTNRQTDRREGHLVEHSGVSRRNGRRVSARLVGAGQGAGGVRRYGQHLRAGEEVQDQDGIRY